MRSLRGSLACIALCLVGCGGAEPASHTDGGSIATDDGGGGAALDGSPTGDPSDAAADAALQGSPSPPPTGTLVIDCPSGFATSGTCGAATSYPGGQAFSLVGNGGANVSGSDVILQPKGVVHNPDAFNFQKQIDARAFSTTFEFVLNGWNIAFVINNNDNSPLSEFDGKDFCSGAGTEGGFYQGYGDSPPVDKVFALDFEAGNYITPSTFEYSNVQIYQQAQAPNLNGVYSSGSESHYYATNKISTSPVAFNSPPTQANTYTGHTYSATIVYTGTNVALSLYDVTAGGTCTPSTSPTCFTYVWENVSIPSLVGGTMAWVGFTGTTNAAAPVDLVLKNWVLSTLAFATAPTFSVAAGTYGVAQSVALSADSPGAIICYNTTGSPSTNGTTGCVNGMLYTAPISVAAGQTIYAVAGGSGYGDSGVASAAYKIGSTASQPTFSPAGGTYQGNQTVTVSAAQGSTICVSTSGTPAANTAGGCSAGTPYTGPLTVSANETLRAVAAGTGLADSAVGSAAYVISPYASSMGGKLYTPANSPTFSPLPGTYSGAQQVSLATTTANAYICYVVSSTTPALLPEPDSAGKCTVGTLYTGPIAVSSSETIYASAGTTVGSFVNLNGPPSSVTAASYTIGGP